MTFNQKVLLVVLLTIITLCLAVKIDFATADLGRHIENGEIVLSGNVEEIRALFTTNYYSYTEGDSPFINHHWLSGVLFYILFVFTGFSGLSIFYIVCMLVAFWLIFDLVRDKISPFALLAISLIAIPVLTSRAEVRPEIFSYLFVALFIWICRQCADNKINQNWLWSLPILQIIWVNVHIGFLFGPFIIGLHFMELAMQKNFVHAKKIGLILFFSGLALLVNPSHIYGALYPFKIFGIYSYRIVENQSINFLSNLGVGNAHIFLAYKILLVLVLLSYIAAASVNWKKISLPLFIYSTVFAVMGWVAIRDFPLFGITAVLSIAFNLEIIYGNTGKVPVFAKNEGVISTALIALTIAGILLITGSSLNRRADFGIGIEKDANGAVEFFEANHLKGPIFNNYDVGGYLIYNLFPSEKVYFDNRPEAYSKSFVENEYIKAMEDPETFNAAEKKYGFNTIFFYYRDYTPWGQAFITRMVFEPDWAPVFADNSIVILLKRNNQNYATIREYEVPKEVFRISK
jgi:hypothetical protein